MNTHDEAAHEAFMALAIAEAKKGVGRTHPNPSVGCVIVKIATGEVIAKGYHRGVGRAHAEIEAIRAAAGADLSACALYVTLEPCCAHGRTPPCVHAILTHEIPRVIVGSIDPDERMRGQGVAHLRAHGVEVTTGVLKAQCDALIRSFAKRVLTGLPWVLAKWAMTMDGKIATKTGHSQWISNTLSRERVHHLRNQYDAVMVGGRTVREDDPKLTCRLERPGPGHADVRDPVRVLVDARFELSPQSAVCSADVSRSKTYILIGEDVEATATAWLDDVAWVEAVRVPLMPSPSRWLDTEAALRALAGLGVNDVMVEGGGSLLGSLFDARLVDEVAMFVAPRIIGGQDAPGPIMGRGVEEVGQGPGLSHVTWESLGDDLLCRGEVIAASKAHTHDWFDAE